MTLLDDVNARRKEIRTDDYSMSISEWISLYEQHEIDIHPEFQRFYRWDESQKTNLIESILLGIPIPPVFVSQREDGIWDVVDGLQRLSTIYQFVGVLRDQDNNLIEPLTLKATKYLPALQGKKWDTNNAEESIGQELRLILKRSKINVSIILKESDETAKYDLFQRLNTGGSNLSTQEVRNCILVMLNKDFFQFLRELAQYENFQECISLGEKPLNESYDLELVLRFIIFSLMEPEDMNNLGDVGEFITEKTIEIATHDIDFNFWENLFKSTFDLLSASIQDNAFKKYHPAKERFMGGFLLSQFEVVACGVAFNIANSTPPNENEVQQKAAGIWSDENYTNWSGSGVRATSRVPKIVPYGREVFRG